MNDRKILNRDRVNKVLDNLFSYPLTIISAAMGYGKTTSVRRFLSLKGKKIEEIWISLLGSDGDETIFWHKFSKAVERLYPEVGIKLENIGFPANARQTLAAVDAIWEMDNGKIKVIVIDDYHLIHSSSQLGKFIELITEEEIPDLHIVLISRTKPKFNHINLLSKGLCLYIDTDTLSFTEDEIKDYLKLMDYSAEVDDSKQIYNYSGGWISAIYLMLIGAAKGMPLNEVSNIYKLVEDNLFNTLDEETKKVLLCLSIFDNFTLHQAVYVLDNAQAAQAIKGLVERNAFIEYDRQTKMYKLHNVLLDFLRSETMINGMELCRIYHRAGQWSLKQKDMMCAFSFYHRAGKIEELLENIDKNIEGGIEYFTVELLLDMCRELPVETIMKYPLPMLYFAFDFILSGDKLCTTYGIHLIEIIGKHFAADNSISESIRSRILGEIEVIKICVVLNDAEKMVEHAQKAECLLNGRTSCILNLNSKFMLGIPHLLYTYHREAGRFKDTVDVIQKGFPPKALNGCGTGCKELALAEYALETGDIQNADFYADKAFIKADIRSQIDIMLASGFVKMRFYIMNGAPEKALDELNRTEEWFNKQCMSVKNRNKIFTNTLEIIRAYIYGCLMRPESIPDWLKAGDFSGRVLMYKGMAFHCIIMGKAALLEKRFAELEAMCEVFTENYGVMNNRLGFLHNSIYLAASKFVLYGMEKGLDVLLPALEEAQMDGIVMPFAENAEFILPMLNKLKKDLRLDESYIEKLMENCNKYMESMKDLRPNQVHLTERETQVLNLLAKGYTQREIAGLLYLSVSSIKKNLSSIYEKMEVYNKISAVQMAQKLGIL